MSLYGKRQYWRYARRASRGDVCRTALHSDLFERDNPDLVLAEIRRGCIQPIGSRSQPRVTKRQERVVVEQPRRSRPLPKALRPVSDEDMARLPAYVRAEIERLRALVDPARAEVVVLPEPAAAAEEGVA
ncbi:MAG TPA: hypothetical protein VMU09_11130 [Acidimicrobiales bacterium]|nr:hypothetical protein [Acidimicrobiales bacterium]